jgi:hypothetical protein
MKKFVYIVVLLPLICGCTTKKTIKKINVIFFPNAVSGNVECGMLPYSAAEGNKHTIPGTTLYKDTVLNDRSLLDSITTLMKNLEPDTINLHPDVRIQCLINYTKGKKQLLCLGRFRGIYLNSQLMLRNDTLTYLIKKNIGFYECNDLFLDLFPEYELFKQNKQVD